MCRINHPSNLVNGGRDYKSEVARGRLLEDREPHDEGRTVLGA